MKQFVFAFLVALACFVQCCIAGSAASSEELNNDRNPKAEEGFLTEAGRNAQDPVLIGSMPPTSPYDTPRHRQERAHLLKRMDRKSGKWNSSHPRYRLLDALYGFSKYRERNMAELERWRKLYKSTSKTQKKLLEKVVGYSKKLDEVEEMIYINEVVCRDIVSKAIEYYQIDQVELLEHMNNAAQDKRDADKISVVQTLKHYVRDWSDEGAKEREQAFPCILETLERVKAEHAAEHSLKVLLPGSGLGRLSHEVANLGSFEVTINEWSMFMNIGYRFIEAHAGLESSFSFHPFLDGMSHHATTSDMLRKITAPDLAPNPDVVLVEGDFNTAFKDQGGHFDIIVTHFFIDTARNLMAYFDTIYRLLKTGGTWINFGPLLYGTAPFVQLSLEEIIAVVEKMGFQFEPLGDECGAVTFEGKHVRGKESEYGFNKRALTKNAYMAQAWSVRKI